MLPLLSNWWESNLNYTGPLATQPLFFFKFVMPMGESNMPIIVMQVRMIAALANNLH